MAAKLREGLLIFFTISYAFGFNIDTKIPFIRKGPKNSYFGFSVAEHQIVNSVGNVTENVLLVGSPMLTRPGDSNVLTGGLYKCSFNNWCDETCDIQIQTESDDISAIQGNRTGQWFGSVVRSSGKGGHVVVCAHRYTINYSGIGKCIALHQSLQFHKIVQPCADDPGEHKGTSFCQVGTSADVNSDGTVVVGGPGAGDWTGAMFTLLVRRVLGQSVIYYSSPYIKEDGRKDPPVDLSSYMGYAVTSGHYYSTDTSAMMYVGGAPHSNGTGQVVLFYQQTGGYLTYRENQILSGEDSFSLFGFDLATVDLNNDGYDDLIVGSPLYYEKQKAGGAIYIYMGKNGGIVESDVPVKITNHKETEEECLRVTCTESRFGFAISPAGDINLDGYPDLVVGAPYEGAGRGAVYLFHGSKDGIVEKYSQRIFADDVYQGIRTFGFAVGGQIDLDQNGYPDVAVGTYQNDTAFLLRTRPIIHLKASVSVFPTKFNLSQPPDCVIPNDQFRKYCTEIKLCMSFTAKPYESFNTPQKIYYKIEIEKDVKKKRAMFVNIDDLYPTGNIKEGVSTLYIQNLLLCRFEKIKLVDSFNDKLTPISFSIEYSLQKAVFPDRSQCSNGVPDINQYPVLVTAEKEASTTLLTQVEFSKECGANDICESNIELTTDLLNFTLPREDDGTYILSFGEDSEVIVDIRLNNTGEPAYETMLYVTVPAVFEWQKLQAVYPPNVSPVYTNINVTTVLVSGIGNPFGNQAKTTNYRHYRLLFGPSKLTEAEQNFKIRIKVNTTSQEQTLAGDVQELSVRVINRAEVELRGAAEPDGDVFYRGPVRGVSSMMKEEDIGPAINHTFTVYNHGPGAVGGATLRIYWPFELQTQYTEGKQLLYLMQDLVVMEGPAECPSYPEFVNSLDIKENPNMFVRTKNPQLTVTGTKSQEKSSGPSYDIVDTSRKKRETEPEATSTDPPKLRKGEYINKNIIKLNCDEKTNCRVLECRVTGLKKFERVKILLRARLWESTLVQDYPSVDEVWIQSTGIVILDQDLNIEQNEADDTAYATTYTIPDLKPRITEEIKWWIILVAVLAGIVLLIIFILILWKCGFFKRLRPEGYEPTYKGDFKKSKDLYDNDQAGFS